jgi:hypothetical protein
VLIVEYQTDSRLLEETLERVPGAVVHSEEAYSTEEGIRSLFWAEADDWDAFEAALADDSTVADPERLAETDARRLYGVYLTDGGRDNTTFLQWGDLDVVLLDAKATSEGWEARMRVPDRDTFARYRSCLRERNIGFELEALYRETRTDSGPASRLSDDQYETLVAAYDAGYFDVPRTASQTDIAAGFDISPQSLSERLRRGTKALVEATLIGTR